MYKKLYAVTLIGVQSKKEVSVSMSPNEDIAVGIAKDIQGLQKEKGFEIAVCDLENGLHSLVLTGIESKKEVTIAILKDVKVAEVIAQEIQSLQIEGGFSISIFELEKKEEQPDGYEA